MQGTVSPDIWDFTFVSTVNGHIDIVQNNITRQLMLRCSSPADAYPVMRAICNIRHRNLMTVYDARILNGRCVSLCEYINGVTLDYKAERYGLCDEKTAKNIMWQICNGLDALHRNGIVHRDIKPENVMLEANENVKIIDYNISRLVKSDRMKDTRILGTAGYASPEQFGFAQTNGRADIYSCGVLLNYLLTGKLPNEELYDGKVTPIISKCIEIDENNRYKSAEELKRALEGKRIKGDMSGSQRNFRPLPGFRSRKVFPKLLAVVLITVWLLGVFTFINAVPMILRWRPNQIIMHFITASVFFVFWSALPYFMFGDIFRISEKIWPTNPQNGRYITKLVGSLSFIVGFVLFVIAVKLSG